MKSRKLLASVLPPMITILVLLPLGAGCRPEAPVARETADFREIVQKAKNKVFPAVVLIKCLRESMEEGRKITQEVLGSGVLISPDGEVLTNWHVVDKATEVRCMLYSGDSFDAKVVGSDKDVDLALIKLQLPAGAQPLPFATLGSSDKLREGDFVMAMGAPWGLNRSVTIGIVACPRRFLDRHSEYSLWLQTDASICPGNSGGPMVNTAGEVVGVNTLALNYSGDMGFAVPSDTIKFILPQLREHHSAKWSWTGLQLQPLKDFHHNIYFEANEGVVVAGTDPESPARRAGIQPRDRILAINGQAVTGLTDDDMPAIRRLLGSLPLKQPARIDLVRGDKPVAVELTPREKGKVEGEELDCPRWDFTAKAINQFDNPNLYFHRKKGVFVFGVKWPGNAVNAGLRQQDIITAIDGKDIQTLDDLKAAHKTAIDNLARKSRAVFVILRNGLMQQLVLDFSRDHEKE
jgi:serine protease Do